MNTLKYEAIRLTSKYKKNPDKHHWELRDAGEAAMLTTAVVNIKHPPVYDLSKWEIVKSWTGLNPKPALVILRATYGSLYVDPVYASYVRGSRLAGYPTWAYHFFRYTQTWQAQADLFIRTVQSSGITSDFNPVLDIEGYLPTGLSRATANGMIENWLYKAETALGRTCHIYSSKNYLNQLYSNTPPLWLTGRGRYLWVAGYPLYPNNYEHMPLIYQPAGVPIANTALWQYSDRAVVQGITGAVDVSDMSDERLFSAQPPPSYPC